MDIERLKNRIDSCIINYEEVYQPDKLMVTKFKARYIQILRELDFNLATFGIDILIQYFSSWSNKERFGKLEYYSNLIASGGGSRKELFILYATIDVNDAIISFLQSIPEDRKDDHKQECNRVMFDLQRSIEHLDGISEKLEILKKYYEEEVESKIVVPEIFRDTPIGGVAFLSKFKEEVESICFQIFPEAQWLYTSIYIPDRLFQFNFEFVQDEPEYTFWFLKYNAKRHFESYIMCEIYENLQSQLRKEHIEGYLKDLENGMQKVKELVSTHQIQSDNESLEFAKETELLRIIEGYYEVNSLHEVFADSNPTVLQYARHIWLKAYLVSLQSEPPGPTDKTLVDYFADPNQYQYIMEILVKEGKCHKDTHIWIDSGSGTKKHLAELFTILHVKGYFINNIRMKPAEKQEVALNTFGVGLSFDTAKRSSKPSEAEFDYIPLSSKISKAG